MTALLVLDFDGTLCDSTEECLLVTFYSAHGAGLGDFSACGRAAIPPEFVAQFERCRPFARRLAHFLVPLRTRQPIASQAQFDAAFARLDPADVAGFVARAGSYRAAVRRRRTDAWLARHTLFDGVAAWLNTLAVAPYIVTARDAVSAGTVLRAHGAGTDSGRIYGEVTDKCEALRAIARHEGVALSELTFVDDSVANVIDAARAGVDARWAGWGHCAPEHHARAREERLARIDLRALVASDF